MGGASFSLVMSHAINCSWFLFTCVRVCDMRNKLLMVSVHFVCACVCDVVFC